MENEAETTFLFNIHNKLTLLYSYAVLTYSAFSKIAKKLDKSIHQNTRKSFMEAYVNKSIFRSCEEYKFTLKFSIDLLIHQIESNYYTLEKKTESSRKRSSGNIIEVTNTFF